MSMSTHKHIDKICLVAVILSFLLCIAFMNGEALGVQAVSKVMGYENRLIASLKQLSQYENLQEVINIDDVLRYFVVHNYVVNGDSYTGSMIHNYYLYEENGQLSMIPWDYNLAFGNMGSIGNRPTDGQPTDPSQMTAIMLITSVLVLAAGLVLAGKFRR